MGYIDPTTRPEDLAEDLGRDYCQGWLDAYRQVGYALEHSGTDPTMNDRERAYIAGHNAGEAARQYPPQDLSATETANRAVALVEDLSREIYYDFNFKIVVHEATNTERKVLDILIRRAQAGRNAS